MATSESLTDTLQLLVWTHSFLLAGVCLVLYEYIVTLSQEVSAMWQGKLTSATLIFFLNRYTTLAWGIFGTLLLFNSIKQSASSYTHLIFFWGSLNMIWQGIWAAFSALRVYAVSDRNYLLALLALLLGLVPVGTNAYTYAMSSPGHATLHTTKTLAVPGNEVPSAVANKLVIITHVSLISCDILVLAVTWASMLRLRRATGNAGERVAPLLTLLGRDGTLHFLILLFLNCLETGLWVTNTSSVVDVLITPLTSIIVSRFLLDLRQLRITVDLSLDTDTIAPAYDTATGGAPGDGSSHVEQISSQYSSTGYLSTFLGSTLR